MSFSVKTCLNVAYGADFFLLQAVPPVIHRDIKSSNILLDQSMRARVCLNFIF